MTGFLQRNLAASKKFKAKLAAREVTTLINTIHPSPSLVERLGEHGFDAVLIDAEHGSVGRDGVEEMSRAAALAGTCAIIRPEASLPHLITGYFGCGVDGFMLPIIRTPEQARELVKWFRFSAPNDYHDRVLIVMIEHIEAIENLPALLEVEGVDAFLVAPGDLALSMGEDLTRAQPSQRVHALMDKTIASIVRAGKVCGMCVNFDTVESFIAKGVTLLYLHTDHMLARGATEYFSKVASAKRRAA